MDNGVSRWWYFDMSRALHLSVFPSPPPSIVAYPLSSIHSTIFNDLFLLLF